METTFKRLLFSCLAFGITACLCLSMLFMAALAVIFITPNEPASLQPTATRLYPTRTPYTPSPTYTPAVKVLPTSEVAQPTATAVIQIDISSQMDEIERQVSELRGLHTSNQVPRNLLTREQLYQQVITDLSEDYSVEEARDDAIELAAFGLLEPDFDLYNLYVDLYSEQIAGFYDQEKDGMYIVQGEGFNGFERSTYSHEYTHALQDQIYDIENGLNYNDEACDLDTERCAALQALLEGDASLIDRQWLNNYASPQDMQDILEFYSTFEQPVYDSTPAFLKEDFIFPYQQGLAFVEYLYDEGGWRAVDEAYHAPPVTTEQILHPERYPSDQPKPVDLPDLIPVLGEGWREISRNTMGEWYTFLTLTYGLDSQARLDPEYASRAAEGWGGDSYTVLYNDQSGETAMLLVTDWDNSREARQFADAFVEYAGGRFGSPQADENGITSWESSQGYTLFKLDGIRTIWILAPDKSMAETILATLSSP